MLDSALGGLIGGSASVDLVLSRDGRDEYPINTGVFFAKCSGFTVDANERVYTGVRKGGLSTTMSRPKAKQTLPLSTSLSPILYRRVCSGAFYPNTPLLTAHAGERVHEGHYQ